MLPDLAAGCSMADMARIAQVEDAWEALADAGVQDAVVPVTYMNSSADIKAFCGRNGGVVCTSSNAEVALEWAFDQKGGIDAGAKVLFLPDQHLGRNTAVLKMGVLARRVRRVEPAHSRTAASPSSSCATPR